MPADVNLEAVLTALSVFVRRAATHFLHEQPSDAPLDGWRYPLLARLADSGPQHAAHLAQVFGLNRSTVGRHLARLEAAGLVRRTENPQHAGRPHFLVTADGHGELERGRRTRMTPLRGLLEAWPASDQQELVRLVEKLNRDLDVHGSGLPSPRRPPDGDNG